MGSETYLQFFMAWRSSLSSSPVIFGDMAVPEWGQKHDAILKDIEFKSDFFIANQSFGAIIVKCMM